MAQRRPTKTPRPRAPRGGSSRGLQSVEPGISGRHGREREPDPDDVIEEANTASGDPLERSTMVAPVADGSSRLTAPGATDFSAGDGAHASPDTDELRKIFIMLRRHFDTTVSEETEERRQAQLDDDFRALKQWDPVAEADRRGRFEPVLTIDQIGTPILQVVNQHRNSLPSIKLSARGGSTTKKKAEIAQDLIRRIEYDSMAGAVYAQAVDSAATNGRGHWKVVVEYSGKRGFDKELKLKAIRNRYSVYRDPFAMEPDKSDARWWILTEDVPTSEYKELYPNSRLASNTYLSSAGDDLVDGWVDETYIRIATYYFCLTKRRRIYELGPGNEVPIDLDGLSPEDLAQLPKAGDTVKEVEDGPELVITNHRDLDERQWYVAVVNAVEILEGDENGKDAAEWPGQYAPIVEIAGEEYMHEGKLKQRGIPRRARDAQVMLNTSVTDMVVTQIKTPKHIWDGFMGQFGKDDKDPVFRQWMLVATGKIPFVQHVPQFNPHTKELLPKPTLNTYEPPIQNLVLGINMALQFIHDTTGWHRPSLGDLTNEERSGRALDALQRATEQGSSHISANFEIGLGFTGRIMCDLIPFVYNNRPGRLLHLLNLDGDESAVIVKQPFRPGPDGPVPIPAGQPQIVGMDQYLDLSELEVSVAVRPGRSSLVRKDEQNRAFEIIMKAAPQLALPLAPSWIRTIDAPGMEALADKIEGLLPENLRTKKPGEAQPVPPEVQQQMQQAQQIIQGLTAALEELQREQDADVVNAESRERVAAMNNKVKLLIESLKAAHSASQQGRSDGMSMVQESLAALARFGEQAHERVMASVSAAAQASKAKGPGGPAASGRQEALM